MSLESSGLLGSWNKMLTSLVLTVQQDGHPSISQMHTSKTGYRSLFECSSQQPHAYKFSHITGLVARHQKGIPDGFANRPFLVLCILIESPYYVM